jgi:hypothetical protein
MPSQYTGFASKNLPVIPFFISDFGLDGLGSGPVPLVTEQSCADVVLLNSIRYYSLRRLFFHAGHVPFIFGVFRRPAVSAKNEGNGFLLLKKSLSPQRKTIGNLAYPFSFLAIRTR